MSTVTKTTLPKKYHDAVVRWRDTFIPDYPLLEENWSKFFPRQPQFELCAYRDCSVCPNIEVGINEGKPKYERACEMSHDEANNLMKAVKAQASTEFGSIQQHRLTLSRAQNEQDQFWVLRMMAEELRHGYQMFHILLEDDWASVSDHKGEDLVEEVLSMRTGSHVLGAFNIDFDSFLDNATFCTVIDRVGKYQLKMQKVSAYKPMSESMPPMLQEEAFHLAAGVGPLRRWATEAGRGEGNVSMEMMQEAMFKWLPRGYDMFGDERGGGRNVKFGFKPMTNAVALQEYIDEMTLVLRDLNVRFVRGRVNGINRERAEEIVDRIADGGTHEGVKPEDLLRMPHVSFLRRRGIHAYEQRDIDGTVVADFGELKKHLHRVLPSAYPAGRDYGQYVELVAKVADGEMEQHEAAAEMPQLSRVGGSCPCSNAVRWVQENGNGNPAVIS
ncbi:MAG: hypothetical protein V3T86_09020 [Planctomycetota bacterium]